MPDYIVTFTAYIDENKRPENFPKVIKDVLAVSFDTGLQLVDFVNKRNEMYNRNQGMGVNLDPGSLEDLSIIDTKRVWVPMHMITYLTAAIKPVTGEMPQITDAGITEMPSGKEVVKH